MAHEQEGSPSKHTQDAPEGASRRDFIKSTAAGLLTLTLAGRELAWAGGRDAGSSGAAGGIFRSRWPTGVERTWIGPEYWSNPLQDWRVADGRLELVATGPDRNVHLLTRQLGSREGTLEMRVLLGFPAGTRGAGEAGFEVGVQGPLAEYRNNAIHGRGRKAGLTSGGRLFIEGGESADLASRVDGVVLRLAAAPAAAGYRLTLSAHDAETGADLGSVSRAGVPASELEGNVALFAGYEDREGSPLDRGVPRVWFRDLQAGGSKLDVHEERAFGPVLFTQYTLSRGVMKLTAQMPPLGAEEAEHVTLQVRRGRRWETAGEEPIHALARTATFRIEGWDASRDADYRLAYDLRQAGGIDTHYYEGTIRKEPVDERTLVMGVLSCATHFAFPNKEIAERLQAHDPDVLAFTGDQLYESSGGYGVERRRDDVPLATLDYLRKWYMHGWSFGEVMRDRPTICMPDDHDVFQGNIWGGEGRAAETMEEHDDGGYFMPAEWVNMVQRTQTSHLPDPFDPTPIDQGITVYYTDMLYGRVSFAIVEDRKWKSGPDGLIPPHPGRIDHITDPDFDPKTVDIEGAQLLGERQLRFLDAWTADWRGADLKVVVSQSAFAQVPTLHGNDFEYLVADLDSNGWPQTPRNEVLRRFRRGFAFQVGGDQHVPMILHYGVDEWDDAGYIFCVPAVATGYPRAFEPYAPERMLPPGSPDYRGRFVDGFGNRFTLHAVANPKRSPRAGVLERMSDKIAGYGIVRIDKAERTFRMEAWPILSDPRRDDQQFPGWPQTVRMEENYGREASAHLPTLVFRNVSDPMVQVVDERDGEVVYTLRIRGRRFRPKVFHDGSYTVRIGDDEAWVRTLERVQTTRGGTEDELEVSV